MRKLKETAEIPGGIWYYYLISLAAAMVERFSGPIPAFIVLFCLWSLAALFKKSTLLGAVGLLAPFMFYIPIAGRLNVALLDFMLPLLVVAAVAASLSDRRDRKIEKPALIYAVYFIVWVAISYSASRIFGQGGPIETAFLLDVFKLLVCLITFWTLTVLADRDFRSGNFALLDAWVAMATVTAALVIVDMISASGLLSRSTAGFEDPNLLGIYLLASAGVVALRGAMVGKRVVTWQTAVILAGVLSTSSRGSMLAACVVVTLLPFVNRGLRASSRLLLATLLGFGLAGGYLFGSRIPAIARLVEGGGLDNDLRGVLWAGALDQWATSPLYGIGLGEYALRSPEYTGVPVNFVAHNTYLSFLAETGIVGFLIFFSVFVLVAHLAKRAGWNTNGVDVVALMVIAVMLNLGTVNAQNSRFFWVFLALTISSLWLLADSERYGISAQTRGLTENRDSTRVRR